MKPSIIPMTILVAEDDPDDRLFCQEAIEEANLQTNLQFVEDGEELMMYLCRNGKYQNAAKAPRPQLILLDLNMPRKDGREALLEIKQNPELRRIPVVVLTTSQAEEDILRSYDIGVSGYITKPPRYNDLVEILKTVHRYWFEVVQPPPA